MRRGIHNAIAVLGILVLAKPFDCFAGGAWTQRAADCCKKSKCAPRADANECCSANGPAGNQFLGSKARDHSAPVVSVARTIGPSPESLNGYSPFAVHAPPGSP